MKKPKYITDDFISEEYSRLKDFAVAVTAIIQLIMHHADDIKSVGDCVNVLAEFLNDLDSQVKKEYERVKKVNKIH